ncbi:hypothetical protein GLOIN_2v1701929 [Rhizophagus irregularis DAOM 181602=DAOM 197198]|uniref:Uncharacterized protein n=1 Tax=Rhizophagus irregularis (strain DAOM 181602 / DAOM 197198 / MUCL 43194) TaxID=747089 RepID=A0A2P4P8J3_RHIID|nr:hypothetical protein GLOIN_2v1701929 [Rhizophagus irregularis DAOM 181602=DAOM 197198]POG61712.1 hypothetical protein GLOIN_2v1701929 [Rhizophagus irregularis DAOM 181602=DAOM 197198]|eukprot:XP_025168578.1 hypothetical protein GLOIN_2v1701929 [Rhizophagus irregularis DAOM 181602=DAOM 197198]
MTLLLHLDTTIHPLVLTTSFSTTILYEQHLLLMTLYRIYLHFIITLMILGPFIRLTNTIFFLQNMKSST